MKVIAIMGPHGAGKDTVINRLVEIYEKKRPGIIKKTLYTTTRKIRSDEKAGKDILLATETEFNQLVLDKKFAAQTKIRDYYSGTLISEFEKSPVIISNLIMSALGQLETTLKNRDLQILKIYINASEDERRVRIAKRNKKITKRELDQKLANDPNHITPAEFKEIDLFVENKNRKLEDCIKEIEYKIDKFIKF